MKISLLGALVALVLIGSSFFAAEHLVARANVTEYDVLIESLPAQIGDWQMVGEQGLELKSREILNLDRYVKRTYRDSKGRVVYLYIGYWRKQTGDSQAAKHSPRLCLPANGWLTSRQPLENLIFDSGQGFPVSSVIGEISRRKMLFYYWFFSGKKTYAQDWRALINLSIERFISGRSDGGIIELSTLINLTKDNNTALNEAHVAMREFASSFYPQLQSLIMKR